MKDFRPSSAASSSTSAASSTSTTTRRASARSRTRARSARRRWWTTTCASWRSMGYIRRDREVSRAIEVTHGGTKRGRDRAGADHRHDRRGPADLRALGRHLGNDDDDETIDVSPETIGDRENVYALRVKGTSMIDALVNDGDVVVMEATAARRTATWSRRGCKASRRRRSRSIYREGDRVRLQPANRRWSRSTRRRATSRCRAG